MDELIFHKVMSRGTLPYLAKLLGDNDNNNKKVFMIKKISMRLQPKWTMYKNYI